MFINDIFISKTNNFYKYRLQAYIKSSVYLHDVAHAFY